MPSNLNSEFRLLGPGEVEERLGKKNRLLERLKEETLSCGSGSSASEGNDYLKQHRTVASFIHASLQQQHDESNSESDSVGSPESSSSVASVLKRNRPSEPTDPVELESTEDSDTDRSKNGSVKHRKCTGSRASQSFPTVFYNIGGQKIPACRGKLEIVKMVNLMSDLFQEKLDWHLDAFATKRQEEHESWKFQVSRLRADQEVLREEVTKANEKLARMDAQLREISSRREEEMAVALKAKDHEMKETVRDGQSQLDRLIAEKEAIQAKLNALQISAHEEGRSDSSARAA